MSSKHRAAAECGVDGRILTLPSNIDQAALEGELQQLSDDPSVHGVLLQRPLPAGLNAVAATAKIAPLKDVDGLHPTSVGMLHTRGVFPPHAPCTAIACMKLLRRYHVPFVGRNAVVLGNSNIIGRPMAELLLAEGACVTTIPFAEALSDGASTAQSIIKEANILVSAFGVKEIVKGSWIKPGAAVLDVGLTAVCDSSKRNGFRLIGDVQFEEARKVAGWITPVPGGIGPVTVATLMENTLRAWQVCCVAGLDVNTGAVKASHLLWPKYRPERNRSSEYFFVKY